MRVKSVIALAAIVGAQNAISTMPEWYSARRVWLSSVMAVRLRTGTKAAKTHLHLEQRRRLVGGLSFILAAMFGFVRS
jgi:hypothetical protein